MLTRRVAIEGAGSLHTEGRLAIVTGASRGIGRQIAIDLAHSGHAVLALARESENLDSLAKILSDFPGSKTLGLDLDNSHAAQSIIDCVDRDVEILIHNVGGNLGLADPMVSSADFMRVMRHNLGLALDLNAHFIPHMQNRGFGRVVHISSVAGIMASIPSYSAAKASLNAYVRSIGMFVKGDGVVVSSVMPGAVLTEGGVWEDAIKNDPDQVEKFISERMAIGRLGLPEDVSRVVMFVVSNDSRELSGCCILVDGGHSRVIQNVETV